MLELLLVATILAALGALVLPNVLGVLERQTLKSAAEDVRADLARCRLFAIDAGVAYQFRFEAAGPQYVLVPVEVSSDALGNDSAVLQPPSRAGRLPEGLRFEAIDGVEFSSQQLDANVLAGLPGGAELAGADWSPPVLFFFDGTAVDASFEIVDSEERTIPLAVRGLTGAASIGEVARRP